MGSNFDTNDADIPWTVAERASDSKDEERCMVLSDLFKTLTF